MSQPECLSEVDLSAFITGTLSEDRIEQVSEHLGSCPECETRLADLETEDDRLFRAVAGAPHLNQNDQSESSEHIHAVIEKVWQDATQNPAPPLPDTLGQYELLEQLGIGGMGTVYKAMHRHLKRVVALKVLSPDRLDKPKLIARFQQEMYAVGQLNHPNIVVAHDAGEANGQHYLVMELVNGIDLSALVKLTGPLEIADACELIRQAAEGLHHAHTRGMVHRDIKPSNLMISHSEQGVVQVKILDMGLALLDLKHDQQGELTSEGQTMGTLEYMAPEQSEDSHDVDARADIYSLGCTLYKLLTGDAPFPTSEYSTPLKLLKALVMETPPPMTTKRDVPAELAQLLDQMLAKDPDDRPASAANVAQQLASLAVSHQLPKLLIGTVIPPDSVPLAEQETQIQQHVEDTEVDTPPEVQPIDPASQSVPSTGRPYKWLAVLLVIVGLVIAAVVKFL